MLMICKHYWKPVFMDSSPVVTYSTARIVDCLMCQYCGTLLRGEQVTYDARRAREQRDSLAEHGAYQQ